jgi:hypothetical protein
MKAYKSLKNGKFCELGRHGIVWYPGIDPASVANGRIVPTLVSVDHKLEKGCIDGHEPGQVDEVIFLIEYEDKKRASLPCKKCGGELKQLKTKNGDPEGIRNDLQCKKCKVVFGQSKTSVFEMVD